jgi:hypothetical protein
LCFASIQVLNFRRLCSWVFSCVDTWLFAAAPQKYHCMIKKQGDHNCLFSRQKHPKSFLTILDLSNAPGCFTFKPCAMIDRFISVDRIISVGSFLSLITAIFFSTFARYIINKNPCYSRSSTASVKHSGRVVKARDHISGSDPITGSNPVIKRGLLLMRRLCPDFGERFGTSLR